MLQKIVVFIDVICAWRNKSITCTHTCIPHAHTQNAEGFALQCLSYYRVGMARMPASHNTRTRPPWFSHKSTPRTQAMCILANRIFVLSSQKHLGIKLQTANTLFEKDAIALSRGAYSAGARSELMRMRAKCTHVLAFLVRPGAQRRKISGTSIKIIS